jgi:hypothetical protein
MELSKKNIKVSGKLLEINIYGKIKLLLDDISQLNILSYYKSELGYECLIIIPKYKDYYTELVEINKGKDVVIEVSTKKYSFNNHKGISLTLQSLEFK